MAKNHQPVGIGMTPSRTELGSSIRDCRLNLGLSQAKLGELAGFSQNSISMIEVGIQKQLTNRRLTKLAKVLQCDWKELQELIPEKNNAQPKTKLGKLIRARRQELNITIEAFAKKMGITCQQANYLETKKSPGIRYGLVKPLASALELEPSALAEFFGIARKPTNSKLGRLIRARRKELIMSLNQLANELNVSRQLVNQIEFGQCRLSESDEMIERLAQALQLDVNELRAVRPMRRLKQNTRISLTPFGKIIVSRRLELQLTQREVGKRIGVRAEIISNLETGKTIYPNPSLIDKLTKVLDCQIPQELMKYNCT